MINRSNTGEPVQTSPVADLAERAAMFKALGDPTRLRIFEFLCACCRPVAIEESGDVRPVEGPTVGDVCCHITGVPHVTSTLSEHLKELRIAGLVTTERRGRNMVCGVNREAIAALADYMNCATRAASPSDSGDCC